MNNAACKRGHKWLFHAGGRTCLRCYKTIENDKAKPDPMDLDNLGVDFTPNERAAIRIRFGMLGPKHGQDKS